MTAVWIASAVCLAWLVAQLAFVDPFGLCLIGLLLMILILIPIQIGRYWSK